MMSDIRRVFVAEDNSLVMLSIEALIEDMGWDLIGPATTVAEGLEMAARCDADVALLDINLAEEHSYGIAATLKARGIPVVFATGYDGGTDMPAELQDLPMLTKPYSMDDMEATLRKLAG